MQVNYTTRKAYQGDNQMRLTRACNYKTGEWLTFLQAKDAGYKIKKGEKGTPMLRIIERIDKKGNTKKAPLYFTVFNIAQTDKELKEEENARIVQCSKNLTRMYEEGNYNIIKT